MRRAAADGLVSSSKYSSSPRIRRGARSPEKSRSRARTGPSGRLPEARDAVSATEPSPATPPPPRGREKAAHDFAPVRQRFDAAWPGGAGVSSRPRASRRSPFVAANDRGVRRAVLSERRGPEPFEPPNETERAALKSGTTVRGKSARIAPISPGRRVPQAVLSRRARRVQGETHHRLWRCAQLH
jgi:hypothetical protein